MTTKRITRTLLRRMILSEVARLNEEDAIPLASISMTGPVESAFAEFPGVDDDARRAIITNLEKAAGMPFMGANPLGLRIRAFTDKMGEDPEEFLRQSFIEVASKSGKGGSTGAIINTHAFTTHSWDNYSLYEIVDSFGENDALAEDFAGHLKPTSFLGLSLKQDVISPIFEMLRQAL